MPPVVSAILFGLVRTALAALFGGLVAHGWATQEDVSALIAWAVPIVLVGLWSAWVHRTDTLRLLVALAQRRTMSRDQLDHHIAVAQALPSVLTPADVVPVPVKP